MSKPNSFIQFFKRLIIGIICFLAIFFLISLVEGKYGIYSLVALALLIGYPNLADLIISKFFNDELLKHRFLKRLHFIFFIFIMLSYAGTVSTGQKFPLELLPFYSLVMVIVFSIKKRRFLRKKS